MAVRGSFILFSFFEFRGPRRARERMRHHGRLCHAAIGESEMTGRWFMLLTKLLRCYGTREGVLIMLRVAQIAKKLRDTKGTPARTASLHCTCNHIRPIARATAAIIAISSIPRVAIRRVPARVHGVTPQAATHSVSLFASVSGVAKYRKSDTVTTCRTINRLDYATQQFGSIDSNAPRR
jgi:hypothetical protein